MCAQDTKASLCGGPGPSRPSWAGQILSICQSAFLDSLWASVELMLSTLLTPPISPLEQGQEGLLYQCCEVIY